ncbi:hypothetical protein CEXT_739911 [Caerostris extrusa]|uniref:Uncharacterized protein n=1 Tax=Caerostris extrusa TaxID=172846 RepID=A0AAV4X0C8_CAEEX|nr:hypothetical protein CEXT_739911 [Caerostris extrusa]
MERVISATPLNDSCLPTKGRRAGAFQSRPRPLPSRVSGPDKTSFIHLLYVTGVAWEVRKIRPQVVSSYRFKQTFNMAFCVGGRGRQSCDVLFVL